MDTSELASRLGSPCSYDRRARVYWYDDFEAANLHWETNSSGGAGAAWALDDTVAYNGEQSLKITCSDTSGEITDIIRHLLVPPASKVGFEISFTYEELIKNLHFRIYTWECGMRRDYRVRLQPMNGWLHYYDSSGNWQSFDSVCNMDLDSNLFHTAKLIFNNQTDMYDSFHLDDESFDLSDHAPQASDILGPKIAYLYFRIESKGSNKNTHVDNAIWSYLDQ